MNKTAPLFILNVKKRKHQKEVHTTPNSLQMSLSVS